MDFGRPVGGATQLRDAITSAGDQALVPVRCSDLMDKVIIKTSDRSISAQRATVTHIPDFKGEDRGGCTFLRFAQGRWVPYFACSCRHFSARLYTR